MIHSFVNQNNDKQLVRVKMINIIDILLMDENNTLLDFNNVNWTLTLMLEIKRFKTDILETFQSALSRTEPDEPDELDFLNE